MKDFWDQLTSTQKYYAAGGAALALALLILLLTVFPLGEARRKLDRSIAANEKILKEMTALSGEYAALKQQAEDIRQALARRPRDFTLFTYLEKKAAETQLKPNIKYINPSRPATAGAFEESSVEMKLDAITMKQMTDFLFAVESPRDLVKVRKIAIAKMKESPEYLTMTLQATTYLPLQPGGR
jgi:general secretion pathway protein M